MDPATGYSRRARPFPRLLADMRPKRIGLALVLLGLAGVGFFIATGRFESAPPLDGTPDAAAASDPVDAVDIPLDAIVPGDPFLRNVSDEPGTVHVALVATEEEMELREGVTSHSSRVPATSPPTTRPASGDSRSGRSSTRSGMVSVPRKPRMWRSPRPCRARGISRRYRGTWHLECHG